MTDENTSIVQFPRDYADVAKLQEETALEQFLEHPLTQSLEAITGAFAVGVRKTGLAAGRVAQAIVQGKMYDQLAEEWRTLREAGKIPDNLGETRHGLYTWAELIKIIDEECPDEDRLEALKAMFYAVNKINSSDAEQIQAYQLWQVTKRMNSAELILLKAIKSEENRAPTDNPTNWENHIARTSGLGILELVAMHEKSLAELRLILPRFDYSTGAVRRNKAEITTLGRVLCNNIETYQIDLKAARHCNET